MPAIRSASVRPPSPRWLKPWSKSISPTKLTGSPQRKLPPRLVEHVLRRYLADRGQSIIAEHFELSLTLGEAIVDSVYGEADPTSPGQLFFVLNTESSFALGVGDAITELEGAYAGMGQAFYDALRQSLYRWIRVYDDMDARERIEQMTEWAEGEDDPESYEIPKLEQDLPPCLKDKQRSDTARPLASFPVPAVPWLRELVETTIELQRVSHSMERPRVDEEWLERDAQLPFARPAAARCLAVLPSRRCGHGVF